MGAMAKLLGFTTQDINTQTLNTMETTTRICRVCGKEKPITEFGKHCKYKDGIDTRCKECRNEIQAEWHREKRAKAKTPARNELSQFTPRELIEELRVRGYKGTLTYTKQIVL